MSPKNKQKSKKGGKTSNKNSNKNLGFNGTHSVGLLNPLNYRNISYPDFYRARFRVCSHSEVIAPSLTPNILMTWKGNSVLSVGPQFSYTGAFAANYPVGLKSLLSSNASAGANSPYAKFRVSSSTIKVEVISNQIGVLSPGIPFDNIILTLVPTSFASFAGTNVENVSEQPKSKVCLMPATNNTQQSCTLTQTASTADIFGLQYQQSLEQPQYCGNYNTDPATLWYWQLYATTSNGDDLQGRITIRSTVDYNVDLFYKNNVNSAVPT